MNSLGEDQIGMMYAGLEETQKNFEAMVIANQGENFSVGANLMLVLLAAQEGEWDELNAAIHRFQQVNMALKYAPEAGGGRAVCAIAGWRMRNSAALRAGAGVGGDLHGIGGGGRRVDSGRRRMQGNAAAAGRRPAGVRADRHGESFLQRGGSAGVGVPERDRSYLHESGPADRRCEGIWRWRWHAITRREFLRNGYKVGGESAFALLKLGAWTMRQGGYISDYDVVVAEKLAHVLSGGRLTGEQTVSEQYLLDLEREAFLSLCGNPKTQERMQFMLKTGKPLRN